MATRISSSMTGGMYWMQDAYTTTEPLPYSHEHRAAFNYIRNSVKVVVNAYAGQTSFYAAHAR